MTLNALFHCSRFAFAAFWTFCVLSIFPAPAQAQRGNEIYLFRGKDASFRRTLGGEILIISLDDATVRSIPLPPPLNDSIVAKPVISPDHRYLALLTPYSADPDAEVSTVIVDLQDNACCISVQLPPEFFVDHRRGAFSPDSRQLVNYRQDYLTNGAMAIIDAATGTVVQVKSIEEIADELNLPYFPPWVEFGDWREDGIRFFPQCYACEPVNEGEWSIWIPESDRIIPRSSEYFRFSSFGNGRLAGTGEVVYPGHDGRLPYDWAGNFVAPNVVYARYPEDASRSRDELPEPSLVYFNPERLFVSRAIWTIDGQAVLILPNSSEDWTLLFRDGTQRLISVPPDSEALVGTPNGWLARINEPEGDRLTLYTVEDTVVSSTVLEIALSDDDHVVVLDAPDLGTSIATIEPFPTIDPRSLRMSGTCPNLLPARLTVNTLARVTPGAPNRLRSDPSLEGAILAEIPGGAQIIVLDGPICDYVDRIIWWQVDYDGLIGWTAEGQEDTYFVEPVGAG